MGEHLIGRGVTPNNTINTGRPYNGVAANVRVCGLFHLLVLHVESFFLHLISVSVLYLLVYYKSVILELSFRV